MSTTEGRQVRVAIDAWPDAGLELRATDSGEGMTFHGYAAVFDRWSEDLGGFRERIAPGAFKRSLASKRNIRMFLNHNADVVLASTKAGTLRLDEDERGLKVEADLPDTTAGRDLATLLRRGDVDSMSFGFAIPKGGEDWNPAGDERELSEVRLYEVSAVTGWPAYPSTSAAVRHLADEIEADADDLAAAFQVLRSDDARLTGEQRDLLVSLINARTDAPLISARSADIRQRLAALAL